MTILIDTVGKKFGASNWQALLRKGAVFLIVLSFLLGTWHFAMAQQPLIPRFNIEGSWDADLTHPYNRTMQCLREGLEVNCISVDAGFAHRIEGFYKNSTQISGFVTRKNRENGCVTHMDVVITLTSNDTFSLQWTDRDGNCDLRVNQQGTDPGYNRIR